MTLYDKDEMADLSAAEKRALKAALEAELARRAVRRRRSVEAMRDHREGRLTLKTRQMQAITVPPINADVVRETREALKMSRHLFAFKIGVNRRTLERWERGRSKPNEQAAALIWLVRKYPDTLKRLESLAVSA